MFGLVLSEDRMSFRPRRQEIINCLKDLPDLIKEVLKQDEKVLNIAKQLYQNRSILIMGRGYNFSTCLEGALKIKELTYMHCEGNDTMVQLPIASELIFLYVINMIQ